MIRENIRTDFSRLIDRQVSQFRWLVGIMPRIGDRVGLADLQVGPRIIPDNPRTNGLRFVTTNDEFLALVERAFPEEPIPHRLLWKDTEDRIDRSAHEDISRTFARQCWKDLTILDWRMLGMPPFITSRYLEPMTFVYYLPSLIIGAFRDSTHIEFALEAITPDNKLHVPRGEWWSEFSKSISPIQRKTLSEFLARTRLYNWNEIGLTNQALVQHAERLWCDRRHMGS